MTRPLPDLLGALKSQGRATVPLLPTAAAVTSMWVEQRPALATSALRWGFWLGEIKPKGLSRSGRGVGLSLPQIPTLPHRD